MIISHWSRTTAPVRSLYAKKRTWWPWSVAWPPVTLFSVGSLHSPWILKPKGAVVAGENEPDAGPVLAALRGSSDWAWRVEWVRTSPRLAVLPLGYQRTVCPSLLVWNAASWRTLTGRSGLARIQKGETTSSPTASIFPPLVRDWPGFWSTVWTSRTLSTSWSEGSCPFSGTLCQ